MKLYIRSDDKVNKVIVADSKTGYAVATFYYQQTINAHENAVRFIRVMQVGVKE